MKTLLLTVLTLLVCVTAWAGAACCAIKAIDMRTGIITAVNNQTGTTFHFSASLALARSMKVGQAVYADFKTGAVTVQGVTQHFSISPSPLMAATSPHTLTRLEPSPALCKQYGFLYHDEAKACYIAPNSAKPGSSLAKSGSSPQAATAGEKCDSSCKEAGGSDYVSSSLDSNGHCTCNIKIRIGAGRWKVEFVNPFSNGYFHDDPPK